MKYRIWLILHFLRYQWRARLLPIFIVSILMGVGTLSAVNFFASSVKQEMDAKSSALLGADWLVESTQPLPIDDWATRAEELGLETAQTIEFLSMISSYHQMQLASVKAVDEGYPLRGQLQIQDSEAGEPYFTDAVPGAGEIWVAARLLPALQLHIGDTVEIGAATFTVSHLLTQEPDAGLAFLAMGPRVLMNVVDLPKTQVIDLGSRVEYRFLVSGDHDDIRLLADEIQPTLNAQEKIENNMTARPEVVQPVDTLLQLLTISALVIFLLAALAIALATRTYADEQTDSTAILRAMGAQKRDLQIIYLISLLSVTLVFSFIATVLGYAIAWGLIQLAHTWWEVLLPMPFVIETALLSQATGLMLVLGFAWPWLLNLQQVSPLRVFQRQLPPPRLASFWIYGSVIFVFCLLWSVYQTPVMTASMLFSMIIFAGVFAAVTYFLLRFAGFVGQHLRMPWRLGVMQVIHEKRTSLMQIWVFAFVLTLMFIFILIRQDFLHTWKDKFPAFTPNYFAINILPNQVNDIEHFFAEHQKVIPHFYPMVRARLIAINDKKISLDDYPKADAPNMLRRDLNLSYSDHLDTKTIVAGHNWDLSDYDSALLSVEEKMAEELKLSLGDTLTFETGVVKFTATIANIRHVDWYSMRPNFYVIATPGLLVDFPTTYLGSFFARHNDTHFLNALSKQFPNLTLLDVDAIISNVRELIAQALLIIEVLFFLVCIGVLLVLWVILHTQELSRAFTSSVLRTLGATKNQLMCAFLSEFAVIGLLSGIIAIILAQGLSASISAKILSLSVNWDWEFLLFAPFVSMLIYTALGFFTLRKLMQRPSVLRLAGE